MMNNMIRFKYCGIHIKDEEYMNKMSTKGWNTKSLTEGFWKFEKGKANMAKKLSENEIVSLREELLLL